MPYEFYLYGLQKMFSDAKNAVAKAKCEGIEIPDSLEKDLQGVEALHSEARKEYLTNRNEEVADILLKKATNGASEVFHEALRLHLSGLFQRACDACDFFKGYDHLAKGNITGYRDVHSKNLSEIKELLENWASRGKVLGKYQIYSRCGQLRDSVLNLGCSIALGYLWGLPGVLGGILISQLVVVVSWKPYFLFTRGFKESPVEYVRRRSCLFLVTLVSATGSWFLLHQFLSFDAKSWLDWIFDASIATATYGAISFCFFFILFPYFRNFVTRFAVQLLQKLRTKG